MSSTFTPTLPRNGNKVSQTAKVHSLARVLLGEFGIPFALYDSTTGDRVMDGSMGEQDFPLGVFPLSPQEIQESVEKKRNSVTAVQPGTYIIHLMVYNGGKLPLLAVGTFKGLARNEAEVDQERRMLEKWVHSVHSRLRLADQLAARPKADSPLGTQQAWDAMVSLEEVIRRVKIHRDSSQCRARILEAAFRHLSASNLVFVPYAHDDEVLILGEPLLDPEDYRLLAASLAKNAELKTNGILFLNEVESAGWSSHFPQIQNVLAFTVLDQRTHGWVLALNKKDDANEGRAPRSAEPTPCCCSPSWPC